MPSYRRPSSSHSSPLYDFATFRTMVTPWLVVAVFWVGTAVCLLGGGSIAVGALDGGGRREVEREWSVPKKGERERPSNVSTLQLAGGLMVMILGPLALRLVCEFEVVVFSIQREMKIMNDRAAAST